MDSQYVKELEEEIKKRKEENDFQFNLAKINNQKGEVENSDITQSQHQFDQEENVEHEQEQDPEQNEFEQSQNNNNNFEEDEDNDLVNEGIKSIVSDENHEENKLDLIKNNQNEKINYDLQEMGEPKSNSKFPNLIPMNSFSVCQCCNKEFDSKKNIPYLLKCNHFFCKTCLENYFTDEEGIKCPIDGLVGKSINDIKILINFVNKNNNNNNINKNNNKKNISKNNTIKGNNGKDLNNKNIDNKKANKNKINNLNILNNINRNTYDENSNENNSNMNDNNQNEQDQNYSSNKKRKGEGKRSQKKNNKKESNINNNNINKSNLNNDNFSNNNINEREEENVEDSPNPEEYSQNFCNIHPEQKISHFVEDTKELICIHCAFNKLKSNPTIQIKEISEKCKEYLNDLDNIIENNQKYSQIINNSLNDIKENKENEEKKIIEIYEQLLNLLVTNRNNFLIKIEELFQENTSNMNKKLENFAEIIDIAEKLKEDFEAIADQAPYEFNHLTQAFNKFIREMNDKSRSDLDIMQYNFSHDELNKVLKYLNNFADVKTRKKCFRFDLLKNNGSQNYAIKEINNNNNFNFINNRNNIINDNSNSNILNNGINKYYKASKELSYINFNNNNNNNNNFNTNRNNNIIFNSKVNNVSERSIPNVINLKNDSIMEGSNNNIRFNFKFDDNDKDSNRFNYNFNKNNGNSNSESINATLNKYIIPNNKIGDNYYSNKSPLRNFQNSGSLGNNSFNNSGMQGSLMENDKLALLNKYKAPTKNK